ncbi:MAG: glucokinase [Gammaproteobacteria bacterium]|nr:glucokinase [Gammaproteobacteria bacterium]
MQQINNNWLIADVGATTSRIAVYDGTTITALRIYRNEDHDGLEALLGDYCATAGERPSQAALAVAAPVDHDTVSMMNRDWTFSFDSIRAVGFDSVTIINDFHAIAFALPDFGDKDRFEVGKATHYRDGTIAVLGPGSGLGMAAWIEGGAAMYGEGGHITLSARDEREDRILTRLRDRFGHVSAERVLSGPGLLALHAAMHNESLSSPEEIFAEPETDAKQETIAQFYRFLGCAAADLALITGASGGVYIAGGIVPAYTDKIAKSEFRSRFEDKNRYRDYMQAIPTWVITDPVPGLRGLAAFIDRDLSASR